MVTTLRGRATGRNDDDPARRDEPVPLAAILPEVLRRRRVSIPTDVRTGEVHSGETSPRLPTGDWPLWPVSSFLPVP
jgi:hypothetical protein